MSIRNLEYLFQPASIAVIGASNRPNSVGQTVMRNLLEGGFAGPIMPVNPKYDAVAGIWAYRNLASLPSTPDLAVICTPPATVPGLIEELARMGTRAAVVLTAGLSSAKGEDGRTLQQAMLDAARPTLMRILGPNCVGLITPVHGVNASFAHTRALPGDLAFVSQSGALTTALLDWAKSNNIGFSHFVSLGDSADVDFGDMLDYLGSDPNTKAILLYIESIREARKFMSAARAASRNKPVIVVKAGRAPDGARAAASHTGALAGSDDVFDAAIRRAGMLRVDTTLQLFSAVETLARAKRLGGQRLAIVTNGGGPGVMATDALTLHGAKLATLSEETLRKLDAVLPHTWSHGNPVDMIGDAPAKRYVEALQALLADEQSDAILFIHAPTAIVPSEEIARACAPVIQSARRNVLSCWLGGQGVEAARQVFSNAGIPTYPTPEQAVDAFLHMVAYRQNQQLLMEVPASEPTDFTPDTDAASAVIRSALDSGQTLLTEPQAKLVLAAYGVPVVQTRVATNADEAARMADEIGYPVAIKLLSPDVTHKSDVGGVVLDLETPDAVRTAARDIAHRLETRKPGARLEGYTVQSMVRRANAHELIVGATTDPLFGPVILFGQGGTAVEVIGDRAVALPPLNPVLARELVSRTRVSRLLAGYRDRPAAAMDAIYLALTQLSQLIADIPEIVEVDINPLYADEHGVIALDARMRVAPASTHGPERLAILPYPKALERPIALDDTPLLLRPIRPDDAERHRQYIASLSHEDCQLRFFHLIKELPRSELARATQIDYDRQMTFVAIRHDDGASNGGDRIDGELQLVADPDNFRAEMAISVRTDLKGHGLGTLLMEEAVRYCRQRGLAQMIGQVRSDNVRMLALAHHFGFEVDPQPHDGILEIRLDLATQEPG